MNPGRALLPSLGLSAATAVVVANMVGQGVFLKGRVMACETGTPLLTLSAWIVAGALAFCGAIAIAELAAMAPEAGGVYGYVRRSLGGAMGFAVGWNTLVIAAPAAIGALATGSAIFFNRLSGNALNAVPGGIPLFAVAIVVLITLVNCAPVGTNGAIARVSAVFKLATLAAIAIAGLFLGHHPGARGLAADVLNTTPCADVLGSARLGIAGFAAAMISALYAYNGWISIASLAGEVRRPSITIPRALIGAVALVTVLYVLANAAFIQTLGFATIERLAPSASVGVVTAEALFGPAVAVASSAFLLVSTIATLHIVVLHFSRLTYAVARDGLFFSPLAHISRHGVPIVALICMSAVAIALVLMLGFERLSNAFVFSSWLVYTFAGIGLFVLRRREPDAKRPYRVTGYPFLPAAFVAVAFCLLVSTAITTPFDSGIALVVTALAFPIYATVQSRRKNVSL